MSAMLKAALQYRSLGFSVLPLAGKAPHARLLRRTHGTRSTKKLVELGTSDEQLHAWFSEPGASIGIFCGAVSGGLVVVDLDDCEFPLPGATLPLTPLVKTGRDPRRGYHVYYRSAEDVATNNFSWGEVRGRTPTYVVAPPSSHPETGRIYMWQLPLEEVPLADFAQVVLPEDRLGSGQKIKGTQTKIRPTGDVLLGTPRTTGDKGKDGWLRAYDRDLAAVQMMAQALGISAPLRKAFPCVIHSDRNPSAALHPAPETGEWLYHDFHAGRHGAPEWLSLAHVRAAIAGRTQRILGPELATWKLILLVEAGLLPLIPVPAAPLPPGTDAVVCRVYERFLFLLGCRWQYEPGAPAPFTRDFAAALCGIPIRDAREAIDELKRLGAIYIAATQPGGGARTLRLWLPRGIEHRDLGIYLEGEAA